MPFLAYIALFYSLKRDVDLKLVGGHFKLLNLMRVGRRRRKTGGVLAANSTYVTAESYDITR